MRAITPAMILLGVIARATLLGLVAGR